MLQDTPVSTAIAAGVPSLFEARVLNELDTIAASVMYVQAGRFEHRPDLWHPRSQTSSKRFQIADFRYAKRDEAELTASSGDQVASGLAPAQAAADAAR